LKIDASRSVIAVEMFSIMLGYSWYTKGKTLGSIRMDSAELNAQDRRKIGSLFAPNFGELPINGRN